MPLKVDSLITNSIVLNGTEINGGEKTEVIFIDMESTADFIFNSPTTYSNIFQGTPEYYVSTTIIKLVDGSYQLGEIITLA